MCWKTHRELQFFSRKKRYELIAKMENLGPFNLFFTLSCGEKRYNENFTTFLKGHNVTYEYKQGREEVFVDGVSLEDILQQDQNQSKHDFIKDYFLRQTLVFDNRTGSKNSLVLL